MSWVCDPKDFLEVGLMLCCYHFEILKHLLTLALHFVFHWALQIPAAGLPHTSLFLHLCKLLCKTRAKTPTGKIMEGLNETIQSEPPP